MPQELDLDRYFQRVKYGGPVSPELSTLRALHRHHVSAIPFENLDPLTGRPVLLDLASVQAKLVHSRRGGYCFEQNLLFRAALEALGFAVTGLAARVRWLVPPERPLGPRSHMLLCVALPDGPYLADVGFGAQLLDVPLRLEVDLEQSTSHGIYKLTEADGHLTLNVQLAGIWRPMYLFNLDPQLPVDYEVASWYTSTHPQMWFGRRLLIERLTAEARHTLSNTLLVECRPDGVRSERTLANAEEFARVLDQLFDLAPPVPAERVYAKITDT